MSTSSTCDTELGTILHGTRVMAASPAKARELMTRVDSFVSNQSRFDRQARLNIPFDALEVTEDVYFHYLMSQVRPWSAAEIEALGKIIEGVGKRFARLTFQLPEVVWLVKTTGEEEGYAAYTRGNDAISLPATKIATLWEGGGGADALHPTPSIESLEDIVTHEFFHLFSKNNPDLRHRLYSLVNYQQFTPGISLPDVAWADGRLPALKITNPDTPELNVFIRMRLPGAQDETPLLPVLLSKCQYESGVFFDDLEWWFMAIEESSSGWIPTLDSNGMPVMVAASKMMEQYMALIGQNITGELFHPDEILAQNFVLCVKEPSLALLQAMAAEIDGQG